MHSVPYRVLIYYNINGGGFLPPLKGVGFRPKSR